MTPSPQAQARTATPRTITLGNKNDGGTGITNFLKEHAEIYREAIRLHGDTLLVLSERDFMEGHDLCFSLHDLASDKRELGLSDFWAVFDLVQALYATRKLFGVEHAGASEWVRYRNLARQLETEASELREQNGRLREIMRRVRSATIARNKTLEEWMGVQAHYIRGQERYEMARDAHDIAFKEYCEAWNEVASALSDPRLNQ